MASPTEKQTDYMLQLANKLTGERVRYASQSSIDLKVKTSAEASGLHRPAAGRDRGAREVAAGDRPHHRHAASPPLHHGQGRQDQDRKSTRLNSSHQIISYAVFCLKKKNNDDRRLT